MSRMIGHTALLLAIVGWSMYFVVVSVELPGFAGVFPLLLAIFAFAGCAIFTLVAIVVAIADRSRTWGDVAATALAAIALIPVVIFVWSEFFCRKPLVFSTAHYEDMQLWGSYDSFEKIETGEYDGTSVGDGSIAEIFIRFFDGQVYYLPDLPEADAARYCRDTLKADDDADPTTGIIPPNDEGISLYQLSTYSGTCFCYRNSQLTYAVLEGMGQDIQVATNKHGPFLDIWFSPRESAYGVFGQPVSIDVEELRR